MIQAPTHLTNVRRLFDCFSSTFYRFPLCHTVFKADGRVHTYHLIANGSNSRPGSTYHRESKMAAGQSTNSYRFSSRHLECRCREDPAKEFWQNNNWERISYYNTAQEIVDIIMSKYVPSIIRLHVSLACRVNSSNTHAYMPLSPFLQWHYTSLYFNFNHYTTQYNITPLVSTVNP